MSEHPNPSGPGEPPKSLQGTVVATDDHTERNRALDQAFDYRGDVTIHTIDGSIVQGYIFDRRVNGDHPYVRIIPTGKTERIDIPYDRISRLEFTGRDTAAGRSWETWVKKYQEKKAKGESANIMPDSLDE